MVKVTTNGMVEAVLATAVSFVLAAPICVMRGRGFEYLLAFIVAVYTLAMFMALSIHALTYADGQFRGKPLLGQAVEFRMKDVAEILSENVSRPPRAKILLRDGKKILIKKPLWMNSITKANFEAEIQNRVAAAKA